MCPSFGPSWDDDVARAKISATHTGNTWRTAASHVNTIMQTIQKFIYLQIIRRSCVLECLSAPSEPLHKHRPNFLNTGAVTHHETITNHKRSAHLATRIRHIAVPFVMMVTSTLEITASMPQYCCIGPSIVNPSVT